MDINDKKVAKKHKAAINEVYEKHGVGQSARQKHAFWTSQYPTVNIRGIDASNYKARTKIFETYWLGEEFPSDFQYC